MNPIKTRSLSAAAAAAASSFRRNYRSLTMIAKLTFQRESLCPTLTTVMSSCLHFEYNLVSEATSKALVASSRTEKRVTRRRYNFALFTPKLFSHSRRHSKAQRVKELAKLCDIVGGDV